MIKNKQNNQLVEAVQFENDNWNELKYFVDGKSIDLMD